MSLLIIYKKSLQEGVLPMDWKTVKVVPTRWPKKTDTLCIVRLNFIKYWPIVKLISLSESGEHL